MGAEEGPESLATECARGVVDQAFRVVTWNCRRATTRSAVWDCLLELAPDVALLQEVNGIPEHLRTRFACHGHRATGRTGSPQRFSTVLLVRGRVGEAVGLSAPAAWIEAELRRFEGNLVARQLLPDNGPPLKAVSVYSPAWPIDRGRLSGIDVTGVRLTLNPDVWVADILWASLQHQRPDPGEPWIVAGDFNLSETFDLWRGGPRGNREYLDRMAALGLGLVECLRHVQGVLTPTFRNTGGGAIKHQMDHLFTTHALAQRLTVCDTCLHHRVFDAGISDHLPVVADFRLPAGAAV